MSLEHFPTDLILEIISRLPAKSVARCRCVSKLWASLLTLGSPYFTELFLTRSKTRPRLLFTVYGKDKEWLLYSCPQPQISSKKLLSVTAEFHMSFPKDLDLPSSLSVSGLIYFPNMRDNIGRNHRLFCNPSTGQILWLPELKVGKTCWVRSFVGYDPIDKEFTVLSIGYPLQSLLELSSNYQILKIGSGKRLFWRNLECPLQQHIPSYLNTYVNGVLYYAAMLEYPFSSKIVCFDIKSEEFKFIDVPWLYCEPDDFLNFKGKFCGIYTEWVLAGERYNLELSLWILEDFERQKWSKHSYRMPSGLCNKKYVDTHQVRVVGVCVTGDIVLSSFYTRNNSFYYVYFFNPEKKSFLKVKIKGLGEFEPSAVYAYVDHVEDLRSFN